MKSTNALIVICYNAFGLFNPHGLSAFLCLFCFVFYFLFYFLFFCLCVCVCVCIFIFFFVFSFVFAFLSFLLFLLNIYYLNVHIQLHRLNKFLQYFYNYLTICTIYWPFFSHSTPVLLVLFLSFLLNIYICIHSYTNTTHSYNIFIIIKVSIF